MRKLEVLKRDMDQKRALWLNTQNKPDHIFNRAFDEYTEARMDYEYALETTQAGGH